MSDIDANSIALLIGVPTVAVSTLSWLTSRASMNASVLPILQVSYEVGKESITLTNTGKGPALQIRLQHTHNHFVNKRVIIKYSIPKNQQLSIDVGEKKEVIIEPDKQVSSDDMGGVIKGLNLYRYIETIGSKRKVGIIFNNIFGKPYLAHIHFIKIDGDYRANIVSIRSYSVLYKIYDVTSSMLWRLMKRPREWNYILNHKEQD